MFLKLHDAHKSEINVASIKDFRINENHKLSEDTPYQLVIDYGTDSTNGFYYYYEAKRGRTMDVEALRAYTL